MNKICTKVCTIGDKSIVKGEPKKKQNTFLVAEGLIIIVQQCYTTRWKRLDVSFKMTILPFLCDEYFLRYR